MLFIAEPCIQFLRLSKKDGEYDRCCLILVYAQALEYIMEQFQNVATGTEKQ